MENSILNNLQNSGALYRVRGIFQCINIRNVNAAEIDALKKLVDDPVVVAGRKVGAYAQAALHILSINPVESKDKEVNDLITILPKECEYLLS